MQFRAVGNKKYTARYSGFGAQCCVRLRASCVSEWVDQVAAPASLVVTAWIAQEATAADPPSNVADAMCFGRVALGKLGMGFCWGVARLKRCE